MFSAMPLAIRTVLFLALIPGSVTALLPLNIYRADHAAPGRLGWLRFLGWAPIVAGLLLLLWATAEFLFGGRGTPAIWFTKPIAFLLGKEPQVVVRGTVYRYTRNPMYLGVLAILFGEALVWASPELLWYALTMCVVFEIVVVFVEEPHLRRERGSDYTRYRGEVPRWFPKLRRTAAHRIVWVALVLSSPCVLGQFNSSQPEEVRIRSADYAPPPPAIRVEAKLVELTVTVRDSSGKSVRGLTAADFEILDAGEPKTSSFSPNNERTRLLRLLTGAVARRPPKQLRGCLPICPDSAGTLVTRMLVTEARPSGSAC